MINIRRLKFLSPVIIFSVIVLSQLLLAIISGHYLSHVTLLAVFVGFFSFIFGCSTVKIVSILFGKIREKGINISATAPRIVIFTYWIFSIIGLLVVINLFHKISVNSSGLYDLFYNLRYSRVYGIGDTFDPLGSDGGSGIFLMFAFCLFLYYILVGKLKHSFFLFFIGGLYSLVMVERTSLLMWILCGTAMAWVCNRVKTKFLFISMLTFSLLFSVLSLLASKTGEKNSLLNYFIQGLFAFDKYIVDNPSAGNGCTIMPWLCQLGFLKRTNFITANTMDSGDFNVFTYLFAPYFDFGFFGLFFTMTFIGMFYSFLFYLSRKFGGYFLAMYILYLFPLVMVFFAWMFSLNIFIYCACINFLLFYRLRFSHG